jgi:small subunit ribosomal protein S18e
VQVSVQNHPGELTEQQSEEIANLIADPEGRGIPRWFLNRQRDYKEGKNLQVASNILETKLREDIQRMTKMKLHRGIRHYWNLKVRGQHTKTTGHKGSTVGVVKKTK